MYWNKIAEDIEKFLLVLNENEEIECDEKKNMDRINHVAVVKYTYKCRLGEKFPNTYFTKRESECMLLLIQGKTINKIALSLSLSPRTVEFYLKNMKAKVGCKTKFELVELVLNSGFLQNANFTTA